MDLISFRCTSCNQGLKIGADKAGRKIKCTKCGTPQTVPGTAEVKMAPEEAPPKPVEEEVNDMKGYGILSAPEEGTELEAKTKKSDQKKPPPVKRKLKTLPDLDLWEKVKGGLQVISIGMSLWGVSVLFTTLIVILGLTTGSEYAENVEKHTDAGTGTNIFALMLSLVAGMDNENLAKIFYLLAAVVSLFQVIIVMAGCGVCLKVPDRYGSQGQLKALLGLGAINLLIILIFRLLPALGVMNYFDIPFGLPEVSLLEPNIDRDPPLWIAWSSLPFLDMVLNVLFLCLFFAQPVLVGVFIWSIGLALREDPVVRKGEGIGVLTLGIAFSYLAFQLLSMTGTSGVALGVLRVVYAGSLGFLVLLLIRLPLALKDTRVILQKYLDGEEWKDDEDDEEEDKKPKRKRKAVPDDDEDDDD